MSQRRYSITAEEKSQLLDINITKTMHETSLMGLSVLEKSILRLISTRLEVNKVPDNVKRSLSIDYEKMEVVVDDEPKIITGK